MCVCGFVRQISCPFMSCNDSCEGKRKKREEKNKTKKTTRLMQTVDENDVLQYDALLPAGSCII